MTHVQLPLTPANVYWPLPWVWLLLLTSLLPALWLLWHRPQRRLALRFSSLQSLQIIGGQWRRRLRGLLPLLRSVALLSLIVAAARPQTPSESRREVVEGVALQMVLDTSWSMMDLDLTPPGQRLTRLDVVKDVFRRFVAGDEQLPGRPHDLVGVIRFARYADSICPLTLDHDALLRALDPIDVATDAYGRPLDEARQTAIGDGLALAVERLKDIERTTGAGDQFTIASRAIILLTDGENNAGVISPTQAGELAAFLGIKVYTIMAGTGQQVGARRTLVDERELRHIADVTGGRHFQAQDRAGLNEIYAEIDRLERSRVEELRSIVWDDRSSGWLLAALVCLALQSLLDATWLRKVP